MGINAYLEQMAEASDLISLETTVHLEQMLRLPIWELIVENVASTTLDKIAPNPEIWSINPSKF